MTTEKNERFEMPSGGQVAVETTSGDVRVEGWDEAAVMVESGRADVSETDGRIVVHSGVGGSEDVSVKVPHGARLSVRSMSGSIRVQAVRGGVDAKTMSGSVRAQDVDGALRLRSVSGSVKLFAGLIRRAAVDTVSGSIVVEGSLTSEGEYTLHTVSGSIALRVPEEQACTLESETLSGSVRCKLVHEVQKHGWGRSVLVVNGGGPTVHVRTTSGSVRVKASKAGESEAEAAGEAESPNVEEPWRHDTRPLEHDEPFGMAEDLDDASSRAAEYEQAAEPFGIHAQPPVEEQTTASASEETDAAKRMRILREIESGVLSVSDGLAQLRELA